jgi:hypothetical protein
MNSPYIKGSRGSEIQAFLRSVWERGNINLKTLLYIRELAKVLLRQKVQTVQKMLTTFANRAKSFSVNV